ncbi:unnamed protein product [Paramecium sonneborni]|uniref:Transmembrane protein n=1 Tax=Paramecium sonneborni TaxID=65129 RepID=A0A8S1RPN0_9CILI|nr:unnamed protein product [Paramecium sonneborni]
MITLQEVFGENLLKSPPNLEMAENHNKAQIIHEAIVEKSERCSCCNQPIQTMNQFKYFLVLKVYFILLILSLDYTIQSKTTKEIYALIVKIVKRIQIIIYQQQIEQTVKIMKMITFQIYYIQFQLLCNQFSFDIINAILWIINMILKKQLKAAHLKFNLKD